MTDDYYSKNRLYLENLARAKDYKRFLGEIKRLTEAEEYEEIQIPEIVWLFKIWDVENPGETWT
jgi:hypothetical protein